MNHRLLGPCLVAFAALLGGGASAADGTFRLGAQLGVDQWDTSLEVALLSASGDLKPGGKVNVGVVGQYIMAGGDTPERDFFVGFEAAWSAKNIAHRDTFLVADIPVETAGDIGWHLDMLWLIGYDFGRVSAVLAGGGSYMANEMSASGAGLAGEDRNMHLGWKIAPGIELEIGPSSVAFLRVGYTQYQSKMYTAPGDTLGMPLDVDIKVEPRLVDLRVGWVYRF